MNESEAMAFGDGAKRVEWKGEQPNGREWIGKLNLFVLTSQHEEMPTVVLEAFQVGTPICGFVPRGGMRDILKLSNGALREVFIEGRDCAQLVRVVERMRADSELRRRVIADGWEILTRHFDAEKNVRGRLMGIYAGKMLSV